MCHTLAELKFAIKNKFHCDSAILNNNNRKEMDVILNFENYDTIQYYK